ncbi:hypothetical protein [Bacillus pumilus]|uniref:hypothetical protein n=1 Tax=Bacillus pumilus TaxID=1408 RepID=UPI0015D52865|nr:hypothetical protein [Bacillus pumilus]QLI78214.1 hypothetical protein HZ310_10510 [Bacillus pumilus]
MWNKNHFSIHNTAEKPFFTITQENGNVDILYKQGDDKKIGVNTDFGVLLAENWRIFGVMLAQHDRKKVVILYYAID